MLTGKTIGELTYLEIPTPDTLIPVELNGGTYHIDFSAVTSAGVIETTYSELVDNITNETLTTGVYYIITDFRTCYDVPEYYADGSPKGSNAIQYNQASVEPIIVFATSELTISSTAYQPTYPNDRIQYDWTFNTTLSTGGDAYGRISERIDEYDNRTDYDHRTILFNRFQSYNKGSQLTGTINSYNSATGIITGNDTLFLDEVSNGDVLLFEELGVKVVSATTDTELLVVVDPTFTSINFTGGLIPFYYALSTDNYYEYKEVYVGQKNQEDFESFLTFNLNGSAIHNYVGDYSEFYLQEIGTNSGFLLANNVFYGNRTYSNTIGDRSYNNTGTYWFSRNTIAGRFYNNVIYNNGFYSNSIGEYFDNNIVKGYTYENTIEQYFENNKIYRNFYSNQIGNYFSDNNTYCEFFGNTTAVNFQNNSIGDVNDIYSFVFNQNKVGEGFNSNTIVADFYKNQVGVGFYSNDISGQTTNNVIGNTFENNTIYNTFSYNKISNEFKGNMMLQSFEGNNIDSFVGGNQFSGNTYSNNIGTYTFDNDFLGYVSGNSWKGYFNLNTIGDDFNGNSFYYEIYNNTIGNNFYGNNIQSYFDNNILGNGFQTNEISNYFENNTIGDGFGYGTTIPQGNKIGNYFRDNTVGEYFYNNSIPDNFVENTIDNYFQWNIVNTAVSGVCLSTGMLYDITTVNVFKNKNGDNRLSYYDESDVLTIETLTEAPCVGGLNALDIPENDLNYGLIL